MSEPVTTNPPSLPRSPTRATSQRALYATFAAFVASGVLIASWVSRIATVRAGLHVNPGRLGLILLAAAAGSVITLPGAGPLVGRIGTARTVRLGGLVASLGLGLIAFSTSGPIWRLAIGLFLVGSGISSWDVAMNVEGTAVERELGRTILPSLHAGYSVGTVVGALLGALVESAGISARAHLFAVAVALAVAVVLATRYFLPDIARPSRAARATTRPPKRRSIWLQRRTWLLGLFTLSFAFIEGSANDWIGVGTVSGYHRSSAFGSITYGTFVGAMTVGRFASGRILDRFGRVRVLRVSAICAFVGVGGFIVGPSIAIAIVGTIVWGFGVATGFPVGMSAASDGPSGGHDQVGAVSTIAYTAFLVGPPFVGLLGDHVGVRDSLSATALLAVAGFVLAGATRETTRPKIGRRP